jgi:hypothetical protein
MTFVDTLWAHVEEGKQEDLESPFVAYYPFAPSHAVSSRELQCGQKGLQPKPQS